MAETTNPNSDSGTAPSQAPSDTQSPASAAKPAAGQEDPKQVKFDYTTTNTQGYNADVRTNVRQHASSYSPNNEPSKTDPTRPAVRTNNEQVLPEQLKADAKVLAKKVSPDHMLALKLQRHAHTADDIQKRYDVSNINAQPHSRCPADSGLHHVTGFAAAFMKGVKHGRARRTAEDAHRHNVAMDIIHHMDKEGESERYLEELKRVSPAHHAQYLKDHPREPEAAKPQEQAPGEAKAPEKDNKPAQDQAEKSPDQTKADEKPTAVPGTETAKTAEGILPTVEDAKKAIAAEASPAEKLEQAQIIKPGAPTVVNDNGTMPDASAQAPTLDKPFLEPWPYNSRLISKAASDPNSLTNDELASAYTSARGQEYMMERLQRDMRAIAGKTITGELKNVKIADAMEGKISLSREDSIILANKSEVANKLAKQLESRQIDTKQFDVLANRRVSEGGISIPNIDAEAYLAQAKAMGDKSRAAQTAISQANGGQKETVRKATIAHPGATSTREPFRARSEQALPTTRSSGGAHNFLQSRMQTPAMKKVNQSRGRG